MIQIGDRSRIIISTRIIGIGAIRFSIAHEIAHLLLKHYLRDGYLGPAASGRSPLDSNGSDIECDASVFATELLMRAGKYASPSDTLAAHELRHTNRCWVRCSLEKA